MKTQKEEGSKFFKFQNRIRVGKNIATSALAESSEHNNITRVTSQSFFSHASTFSSRPSSNFFEPKCVQDSEPLICSNALIMHAALATAARVCIVTPLMCDNACALKCKRTVCASSYTFFHFHLHSSCPSQPAYFSPRCSRLCAATPCSRCRCAFALRDSVDFVVELV